MSFFQRSSWTVGDNAHLSARADSQAHRRAQALEAQAQHRHRKFSLCRQGLEIDDSLEDLNVDSDSGGEDEPKGTESSAPPNRQKQARQKNTSKENKRRWARFADRIMYAELLDLSNGLPDDFVDSQWLMLAPVPRGRRCLALSFSSQSHHHRRANTLLLSRASGKPISRFHTVLPANSILDCIADTEQGVLWIVDLLQWNGHDVSECDAEFRFFWRDSKAAEMPLQSPPLPVTDTQRKLYVCVVRCLPTTKEALPLVQELAQYRGGLVHVADTNATMSVSIPCTPDGILVYVKWAAYESGLSSLAGWIPVEGEGVKVFCDLVSAQVSGQGEAADAEMNVDNDIHG